MTEIHEVDPQKPMAVEPAIQACTEAIRRDRLIVFPTETVYGLAARPDHGPATAKVFEAKRRPPGLNLPVLAGSTESALALTERTAASEILAARFWPGPLTMVLPRGPASAGWSLGDRRATIGVRVPDHPISLQILALTGPVAATSANLSGRPPLVDRASLIEAFGELVAVYVLLPGDIRPPRRRPSTVVDLTSDPPRILRQGSIHPRDLASALGGVQARFTR